MAIEHSRDASTTATVTAAAAAAAATTTTTAAALAVEAQKDVVAGKQRAHWQALDVHWVPRSVVAQRETGQRVDPKKSSRASLTAHKLVVRPRLRLLCLQARDA